MRKISFVFILFMVASLMIYSYRVCCNRSHSVILHDTVYVRDTFAMPAISAKVIKGYDNITFYKGNFIPGDITFVHDTITDSVTISVPITSVTYEDSAYKAVVSGYHASLDTIIVKSKTIYSTNTITTYKQKKWGVGVSVGYDVVHRSPSVLLGINYNLISF